MRSMPVGDLPLTFLFNKDDSNAYSHVDKGSIWGGNLSYLVSPQDPGVSINSDIVMDQLHLELQTRCKRRSRIVKTHWEK